MKVYQYDEKNYYTGFLSLDNSDKSPSGAWNVPAHCVEIAPPAEKEKNKIKWNGIAWEYEQEPEPAHEPEPTLEELKLLKRQQLKADRDRREVQPVVYNENSFDYDDKARDRINAAIIALDVQGEGATIEWTLADNTSLTVTSKDLKMVIAAVAVRSNELHVKYRAASDKVDVAKTKEDLEKITLD